MSTQDWQQRVSQPQYSMVEEKDRFVAMRDGVRLACDIYRPDAPGQKFPALLSTSLYGKNIQKVTDERRPLSPRHGNGGQEAGDTRFFVSRGYVHVIADSRGAGDSEGEYNFQGQIEQQDGYDLIEWIASQPWCDGNVGMLGMSYFAVVQNLIATTQPPHLKAIAPYEAYTDRYRHSVYQGGLFNEGFFHQWWGHVSIGTMRPLTFNYYSEKEIGRRVEALKKTPEVQDSPFLLYTFKISGKKPADLRLPDRAERRSLLLGALGLPEVRPHQDPGAADGALERLGHPSSRRFPGVGGARHHQEDDHLRLSGSDGAETPVARPPGHHPALVRPLAERDRHGDDGRAADPHPGQGYERVAR